MTTMTPQERAKHILTVIRSRKAGTVTLKANGDHLFNAPVEQEPEFKSHEWLERKAS